MSMIEDDLRAALRALGDEVPPEGVPPLHLPDDAAGWNGSGSMRADGDRRARWLAPAAAAAAVLAIVAGVVAIRGRPHDHRGQVSVTSRPCAVCLREASHVPRYYVAETGTKRPYPGNPFIAGIYQTRTGAKVANFGPSTGQTIVDVYAAADDRTFAIASQEPQSPSSSLPATHFSLVHFNASGNSSSAGTSPLPLTVPAGATFDAFALSPDGSRLAVAFEPNQNAPRLTAEIKVLNIRTGSVRTWTSSQGAVEGDTADPQSMSWAADNATLAFNWYGTGEGLRLLNVATPGRNVVADSRLSVRIYSGGGNHATSAGYLSDVLMLTPDGKTVVGAVSAFHGNDAGFAEFSAKTGHLERRLDWRHWGGHSTGGPMDVLWACTDGSILVVYAPPGHANRIGILHDGQLTMLPQSAKIILPGAAW